MNPPRKHSLPIPGLRWRGFTLQLFLLTILPLTALLLALAFGSLALHREAMRTLVGDRDLRAARAAANSLSEQLDHRATTIAMLSKQASIGADLSVLAVSTTSLDQDFAGGLALLSAQGEILEATPNSPVLSSSPGVLQAIAVNAAQAAQQTVFSTPFQAPAGQGPYWVMALRRTPQGNLLAGLFTPTTLAQQALNGATDPNQATVLLVAPGNLILYQSGPLAGNTHLTGHPGIAASLQGESGIDYAHPNQGGEHVIAFSPVEPLGWGLVLEESWESVASPLLNATQAAPLIVVPLLLLALLALWFGLRQIVQPLQSLQEQAAEIAHGDFSAIEQPVGGIDEIRLLQSDLANMASELQSAQDSLRGYIGAITAGTEGERRALARELHDDTLQALIALQQRAQLASRSGNPQALAEVQDLIQEAVANLRRLVRGLRPIYLEDLGLSAALNMLTQEVSQAGGLAVHFTCAGSERRLKPEAELALYRMAQEALSNVTRHAQAANAWLSVDYQPELLTLTIRDDGRGFTVPATLAGFARQGHYGLLGLNERAEIIGAEIEIESGPGKGTTLTVRKPAAPED